MRWFGAVPKSKKGSVVIERPKPAWSNGALCSQGSKTPYHRAVACSSGPSPLPLLNAGASSSGESGAKTSCRGALGSQSGTSQRSSEHGTGASKPSACFHELTSSGPISWSFMFWIETSEIYSSSSPKNLSSRVVFVTLKQPSEYQQQKSLLPREPEPSAFIGIETKRHCPSLVCSHGRLGFAASREEENSIASQLPPN